MRNRVLCYTGEGRKGAERLKAIMEKTVGNNRLDGHEDLESLTGRLRQLGNGVAIAVLFVGSYEDLSGILTISDLLEDIPTIFILPDGDSNMVARALSLRPRFLSYVSSDFSDVAAILERLLANLDGQL